MKKLLCLFLVFVLAFSLCSFCACNPDEQPKKAEIPIYNDSGESQKALIILPGLMASNLISLKTEKPLWSIGSLISNVAMNEDMLSDGVFDLDKLADYLNSFLKRDSNGNRQESVRAANMNDENLQFGVNGTYSALYTLAKAVGDEAGYVTVVFQYDWTDSCADSAKNLREFVLANNYCDLILIGHSMGGLVIDNFLTLSDQKDNVKAALTLGTPHRGTPEAACALLFGAMPSLSSLIDADVLKAMISELNGKLPDDSQQKLVQILSGLARSMPSLYDLLPDEKLFTDAFYADADTTPFVVQTAGGDVADVALNYPEFVASLAQCDWAQDKLCAGLIKSLTDGSRTLYSAEGVHVFEAFGGSCFAAKIRGDDDKPTTMGIKLTADGSGEIVTTFDGDLLVLFASAGIGSNVTLFDGINHLQLVEALTSDGEKTAVGESVAAFLAVAMAK